jgi:MFS family permease
MTEVNKDVNGQKDQAAGAAGSGRSSAGAPSSINPMHLLLPLALAQFINAYDTTAMNVAVSKVVTNLHTTVSGVQTALVIYSLVMAACMITGSKLGDIWGRNRTFAIGITMYGVGAFITALSLNLGMMTFGWSLLEGLGSALMIPAIFALVGTVLPPGKDRLKGYAIIGSAAAGGAAMGPLLMGFWATLGTWTWRLSFVSEVVVALVVLAMLRRMGKAPAVEDKPKLDIVGAVLSALGLALIVLGVLQASQYGWIHTRQPVVIGGKVIIHTGGISPVIPFVIAGIVLLSLFVLWQKHKSSIGKEPLIDPSLFKSRTVAVGMPVILMLMFMQAGLLFVVPVFLQISLNLSPILCGLIILPLTVFVILFSQFTGRLTKRFSPRTLILVGMAMVPLGIILVWALLSDKPAGWQVIPGGIIVGIGIGLANAPLLNTIQSSAPAKDESEISGINRAFSNLGGSFGTAVAGAVLISVFISSTLSLFGGNDVAQKYVTVKHKQEFKQALNKDAQTISDKQARTLFSKVEAEALKENPNLPPTIANDLKNTMVGINQKSRNKGLLAALLAVGIIGILGFCLSFFLPHIPKSREDDDEEPADKQAVS